MVCLSALFFGRAFGKRFRIPGKEHHNWQSMASDTSLKDHMSKNGARPGGRKVTSADSDGPGKSA